MRKRPFGFTLIELMVALTIGLFILLVLTYVFANTSQSNREIDRAQEQIENGRYALQILTDDLRLAGYYGYLSTLPTASATAPDPCDASSTTTLYNALAYPVQGYRAPDLNSVPSLTGTTCDTGLLPASNLQPGSDVLVIRRASTAVSTGAPTDGAAYLQANVATGAVYFGSSGANLPTTNAAGQSNTIFNKDGTTPADTRQLIEHIYFVAPCRQGSGTGGVCQAGDDSIPTLKRLDLSAANGVATMAITPLVDGIDYFKVEYGIDNAPTTPDPNTGLAGDGIPDTYTATPSGLDWTNVVSARIYIVARNVNPTQGFTDDKTYQVGSALFTTAANDAYKRHQFETEVRLTNIASRRDIP